MKNKEIRREARENLRGNWGTAIGIVILQQLVMLVLGGLSSLAPFLPLLISILLIPLEYAITLSFKKLMFKEEIEIFEFIKDTFKTFERAWSIKLRTFLKLLVPYIILAIDFIAIIILSISNTILASYTEISTYPTFLFILLLIIAIIPISIWATIKSLLFIVSNEIGCLSPNLSAKEIVNLSEKIMKGKRCKLIGLNLSFIGWSILGILSLGIGFLWITPYYKTTLLCFAKDILNENNINIDNETTTNDTVINNETTNI